MAAIIKYERRKKILGLAFGVAIGSVIGVLTDNLALWISLKIAIGTKIGIVVSQKKDNIKQLNTIN